MDGSHLGLFQIPSISKAVLENLNTKGIDFKAIRSVDVETLLRMDRHHIGGGHLRFFSNWSNIVDFPGEPYNMKPWYQYEASLFSGVGDIGMDEQNGELPKLGRWPPSWIFPNSAQI